MRRLLRDKDVRRLMSLNGQEKARKVFNMQVMARAYEELFLKHLSSSPISSRINESTSNV